MCGCHKVCLEPWIYFLLLSSEKRDKKEKLYVHRHVI